jgi:hypothetical protein
MTPFRRPAAALASLTLAFALSAAFAAIAQQTPPRTEPSPARGAQTSDPADPAAAEAARRREAEARAEAQRKAEARKPRPEARKDRKDPEREIEEEEEI